MSERHTIARITREGEHFEILVKPQHALSYRLGKITSISEALIADTIFIDANKGLRASEDKLQKTFGTLDPIKIASVILKKGTLQLTTEQRRQMIEDKRKQIISFISRQCVDPRTNLPHPPLRIEQAWKQIHHPIDPFKEAEEQAKEIIKLLRPILPLTVIGKVVDVGFSGWMLDINAPYFAMLRASDVLDRPFKPQKNDLFSIFNIGDLIIAKVVAYNRTRDPRMLSIQLL